MPTAARADEAIDEQTMDDIRVGRIGLKEEIEGKLGLRLWDNIDQTWTKPLPADHFDEYRRKAVFRCTGCNEVSVHPGQIRDHIERARKETLRHKRGKITLTLRGTESIQVCNACGATFSARKDGGNRHLAHMKEIGPAHLEAEEKIMLRFSVSPK